MLNIIQIQDRLKGMPKEAIIQYVQNPTGDVPTYLALGELQRRKTMESKYNAMKPEAPSVAEQIVQENMPMGLGSMPTQDVMPPQSGVGAPQPQPRPTPDMMASSGIGALPAGNIGQNYAGGGIVAFEEGGEVEDDYGLKEFGEDVAVEAALLKLLGPAGMFLSPGEAKASTLYSDEEFAKKLGYANGGPVNPFVGLVPGGDLPERYKEGDPRRPGFLDDPFKIFMGEPDPTTGTTIDAQQEFLSETAKLKADKLKSEEAKQKSTQTKTGPAPVQEPSVPAPTMKDRVEEFRSLLGPDKYRAQMEERMSAADKKIAEREGKAPYFAIMEAGLAMAAGSSPFALQNIAAGATRGISSYQESQEALQAMEEKRLALLDDMAKADRAEKIAAVEYGMNSQQFEDTQALKAAIANQEKTLKLMELNVKVTGTDPERGKIATDIIESGEMQAWTEKFLDDKGSNYEDSPDYYDAYQAELGRRVNQRLRAGTERALYNTTNFNVIGM
jgi:hypothetical protein